MTICDAAKYLEGLFADKNVGDDIEGIVQEEIEAAQVAVWLLHDRMRRDALQPLDENGMVPCGCGGVTEQTDFHDGFFPYSRVECLECGIQMMRAGDTFLEAHAEVKRDWNTAMGWKGGAE